MLSVRQALGRRHFVTHLDGALERQASHGNQCGTKDGSQLRKDSHRLAAVFTTC